MELKNKLDSNRREVLSLIMLGIFLLSLLGIDWNGGVVHSGGGVTLKELFYGLLNPELSTETFKIALFATWQTFSYALISISIAIIIGFILGILASGVILKSKWTYILSRGILGFLRSIHELVWAWIFVAAIGLNPLGAIFALAIPYSGALGKVYADSLVAVDRRQIKALETNGASRWQLLLYGFLPTAFPDILTYTLYRLECAVRSSSVLSFVGLGGLGFQIQLALQDLSYDRVWVFIIFLLVLVILIDTWGTVLRKKLSTYEK